MNWDRIERVILLFDTLSSDGFGLLFSAIVYAAWLQGNEVTVKINEFGEARAEVILMPLWTAVLVLGTLIQLRRWRQRRRAES